MAQRACLQPWSEDDSAWLPQHEIGSGQGLGGPQGPSAKP